MVNKIIILAGEKLTIKKGDGKYKEGAEIDLIEAAYMLYQNKALVIDQYNNTLGLKDLFIRYGKETEWWILFSVFTDLIKRGFKVKKGYGVRDLIATKGDKRYRIFVTEEGIKIKLNNILSWIENTHSKDLDTIIAVVDMYGDITYYSSLIRQLSRSKRP